MYWCCVTGKSSRSVDNPVLSSMSSMSLKPAFNCSFHLAYKSVLTAGHLSKTLGTPPSLDGLPQKDIILLF